MADQVETIETSDPSALPAEPLVSVYMLAYRHEKFITDAIEGVLTQQCSFPIELIIAEDRSSDNTFNIALKYQRRFPRLIRVLTSQSNVGMHANAERAVAAAKGRYIAICEGDDYWHHPQKLQMQVQAMLASPDATLCHTDYDRKAGHRIKRNQHAARRTPHVAQGRAYESLLNAWSVMTATAMYRADVLKDFYSTPFNNPSWPFGDYCQALYASVCGQVLYIPVSTATWRKVAGSASNADLYAMLKMRLASVECRKAFMDRYPVPDHVRKAALGNANRIVLKYAFYAGDIDAFTLAQRTLVDLGCHLSRFKLQIMRFAIQTRFTMHVIKLLRGVQLRIAAD